MGLTIDRSAKIGGVPAIRVRDAIRRASHDVSSREDNNLLISVFDVEGLAAGMHPTWSEWLDAKRSKKQYRAELKVADAVVRALVAEGYATKKGGDYHLTEQGNALTRVKFQRRLTPAEAMARLRAFLDRVEAANNNPELLEYVDRVVLYGSLLTERPDYGDIDLIVDIQPPDDMWEGRSERSIARAEATGRNLDFLAKLHYSHTEVMRIVKNRDRYLHLNGVSGRDAQSKIDPQRVLVERGVVLWDALPDA